MAITMRMVARIFVFATEVTQGPLSSVHYTHIKHTPESRCTICSGFEDTTKTSPRSRGTCLGDFAGDRVCVCACVVPKASAPSGAAGFLGLKRFDWLWRFPVKFDLTNQLAFLKELKERTISTNWMLLVGKLTLHLFFARALLSPRGEASALNAGLIS